MSELGSTEHTDDFIPVTTLEELKTAGMVVISGARCALLVVHDGGKVFALDNRCPHLGFPLHRGSVEDGILTCHLHHTRFDLASDLDGGVVIYGDDVLPITSTKGSFIEFETKDDKSEPRYRAGQIFGRKISG